MAAIELRFQKGLLRGVIFYFKDKELGTRDDHGIAARGVECQALPRSVYIQWPLLNYGFRLVYCVMFGRVGGFLSCDF